MSLFSPKVLMKIRSPDCKVAECAAGQVTKNTVSAVCLLSKLEMLRGIFPSAYLAMKMYYLCTSCRVQEPCCFQSCCSLLQNLLCSPQELSVPVSSFIPSATVNFLGGLFVCWKHEWTSPPPDESPDCNSQGILVTGSSSE